MNNNDDDLGAVIRACETAAKARPPLTMPRTTILGELCAPAPETAHQFDPDKVHTRIPAQAEYEARERTNLIATLRDVEAQPLADRREARTAWGEALTEHGRDGTESLVAERVGWLLNGSYGKGAHDAAWAIVSNTRSNRVAALGQLIAALEWSCPANFAAEAWRKLTPAQQKAVNTAVQVEIDYAVKEREGNA